MNLLHHANSNAIRANASNLNEMQIPLRALSAESPGARGKQRDRYHTARQQKKKAKQSKPSCTKKQQKRALQVTLKSVSKNSKPSHVYPTPPKAPHTMRRRGHTRGFFPTAPKSTRHQGGGSAKQVQLEYPSPSPTKRTTL